MDETINVTCGDCGAEPGAKCVTPLGQALSWFHRTRRAEALS